LANAERAFRRVASQSPNAFATQHLDPTGYGMVHTTPTASDSTVGSPQSTASGKTRCALLVSVRDLSEAKVATNGGVDILDFKEPRRGALAACDPSLWRSAVHAFPSMLLSAALGEGNEARMLAAQVPQGFRYIKVGPSGQQTTSVLTSLWDSVEQATHGCSTAELVPVAYADFHEAKCVTPGQVLDAVIASGRRRLLIDTFAKDGRSLLDHLTPESLRALLGRAREAGVWIALAGSVQLDSVHALAEQRIIPSCWGVRGDVCRDNDSVSQRRVGAIDKQRLARWRASIS